MRPVLSPDDEISRLRSEAAKIAQDTDAAATDYAKKRATLEELERTVAIYDERLSFASFGIYEPHFDFGDSEEYKVQINDVRDTQKSSVRDQLATHCPTDWTVEGSIAKGPTMINRQTRLTLRAFNSECAAAIANVRWNNVVAMEKRILNAAKQIDSANATMKLKIDEDISR